MIKAKHYMSEKEDRSPYLKSEKDDEAVIEKTNILRASRVGHRCNADWCYWGQPLKSWQLGFSQFSWSFNISVSKCVKSWWSVCHSFYSHMSINMSSDVKTKNLLSVFLPLPVPRVTEEESTATTMEALKARIRELERQILRGDRYKCLICMVSITIVLIFCVSLHISP